MLIQCCDIEVLCKCCEGQGFDDPSDFEFETLDQSFDHECRSREYKVKGCIGGTNTSHLWEFEDGTTSTLPTPPPHIFKNFINEDGKVWVRHTVVCLGTTYVHEEEVDFPNGVFVGATGTSTYLTDVAAAPFGTVKELILQNYNLPALPLIISGELIINENFALSIGTLYMVANSQITVLGNTLDHTRRSFSLSGTQIVSTVWSGVLPYSLCPCWKGIVSKGRTEISMQSAHLVSTEIRDALIALRIEQLPGGADNCKLSMIRTNLLANIKGIEDEGVPLIIPTFERNNFGGSYQSPYAPPLLHHTLCGCDPELAISLLNIPTEVVFPAIPFSESYRRNTITNYISGGIYALNTSVNVNNFNIIKDFHDITFGIYFENRDGINSNFTADNIYMDAVTKGVVADAYYGGHHTLTAVAADAHASLHFNNVNTGYDIIIGSGTTSVIDINANKIFGDGTNDSNGIEVSINEANGNIVHANDNDIDVSGADNTIGILLNGPYNNSSTNVYHANYNNIELVAGGDGVGIFMGGLKNAVVRKNVISGFGPKVVGIENLNSSNNNLISCNNVSSCEIGIKGILAENNILFANTVFESQQTSIEFQGSCQNTKLYWNTLNKSFQDGLAYRNLAVTGDNLHENYNSWFNIFNLGANKLGSNPVFSKFRAPLGSSPGSQYYPVNNGSTPPSFYWFNPNGTAPGLIEDKCAEPILDPMFTSEGESERRALYESIITDELSGTISPMGSTWQKVIYEDIQQNPGLLTGSTILANFISGLGSGFIPNNYANTDDLHTAANALNSTSLTTLQSALESSSSDLRDALSSYLDPANDSDVTLWTQSQLLASATISLRNSLASNLQSANNTVDANFDAVSSDLAAITTSVAYEENAKVVKAIVVKYLKDQILDAQQRADLRSIAALCVDEGGMAVVEARHWCMTLFGEYYQGDDCEESFNSSEDRANVKVASNGGHVSVFPNPATDHVKIMIETSNSEVDGILEVSDMSGKVVRTIAIKTQTLDLNLLDFNGGVYWIRIKDKAFESKPVKMVVIH